MSEEKASENKQTPEKDKEAGKAPELKDEIVTTTHEIIIHGQPLHYTATAGSMVMKDEEGKARQSLKFSLLPTRKKAQMRTAAH